MVATLMRDILRRYGIYMSTLKTQVVRIDILFGLEYMYVVLSINEDAS
jgi:hypothetical protein